MELWTGKSENEFFFRKSPFKYHSDTSVLNQKYLIDIVNKKELYFRILVFILVILVKRRFWNFWNKIMVRARQCGSSQGS